MKSSRDLALVQTLDIALAMLVGSALLLILSMFVSVNAGMLMIAFAACVAVLSVMLSLWISRRSFRQLTVYVASVVLGIVSLPGSIHFLNWLSVSRHDSIGPGGGFSIAIGSTFLSILLTMSLLLSTVMAHKRNLFESSLTWPISCNHLAVLTLWLSVILFLGVSV